MAACDSSTLRENVVAFETLDMYQDLVDQQGKDIFTVDSWNIYTYIEWD